MDLGTQPPLNSKWVTIYLLAQSSSFLNRAPIEAGNFPHTLIVLIEICPFVRRRKLLSFDIKCCLYPSGLSIFNRCSLNLLCEFSRFGLWSYWFWIMCLWKVACFEWGGIKRFWDVYTWICGKRFVGWILGLKLHYI